jgi:CRISPR system Cascade subunit CasE
MDGGDAMMLSRLVLHPLSREVAVCVHDAQRLHQFVQFAFGSSVVGRPRAEHGVLHRLEVDSRVGSLVLYVQSNDAPDWSRLPRGALAEIDEPNPGVRSLDPVLHQLVSGTVLRFRLRANVTRCLHLGRDGKSRGPRVPLRSDDARLAWLVRKGGDAGFEVDPAGITIVHEGRSTGNRNGSRMTFEGVRFDGWLRIRDADRFRDAVRMGIGPAKAYGFGLLSIAPDRDAVA